MCVCFFIKGVVCLWMGKPSLNFLLCMVCIGCIDLFYLARTRASVMNTSLSLQNR